ncbi:MAG TPA: phytanoyl-CoA dioxygenase family protein [Planctomycetota bacterium]|nr:phytanoyl-CoA dioxygenase family protein [Planctomycetota bacterium]
MTKASVESSEATTRFAADGFVLIEGVFDARAVDALGAELAPWTDALDPRRGGVRDLLRRAPAARRLAGDARLLGLAEAVLGPGAFAIRGTLFRKSAAANWKVAWHQDLCVALARRLDVDGFAGWTERDGVVQAQPPRPWLERRLAVRVHLDDCGADDGPLRLLPGTHRDGRLDPAAVDARRAAVEPAAPLARRGDVLLLHPMLLHASSNARGRGLRRVVHLEFAASDVRDLPGGLAWRDAIPGD